MGKSAKGTETLALEKAMDTSIGIGRQLRQIQPGIKNKSSTEREKGGSQHSTNSLANQQLLGTYDKQAQSRQ